MGKKYVYLSYIASIACLLMGVCLLCAREILLGVVGIVLGAINIIGAYFIAPYLGMSDLELLELRKQRKLKILEEWRREMKHDV